ncbi:hypothetical protein HELRODRAFT_159246 [Helobdella robusta]|uniref:Otopetrin n=1 Tax=Helobdella robusta TaxID=6412 RepID=T1ENS8_HELRO|nr:hypothetical protein HELRODRAFT_159246 [Helobdella robusta]ESO12669.1 hypothetical protein HELRODRAFT_159246 [Helobdella robusta]
MNNYFKPSALEYTKLVSVVYAVVLMSFGIIFPIAEALKDQWLKTVYNTVFLTFNLTLSSIFLVYLLVFILKKEAKNNFFTEAFNKLKNCFPTISSKISGRRNSLGIYRQNYENRLNSNRSYLLSGNSSNGHQSSIDKSADEINVLKPRVSKRESFSSTSFGGIDLGHITPKDKDAESCPDSDLYFQSREIEPATDIPKLSGRMMHRSSICATIQENSAESVNSDESLFPLPTALKHRQVQNQEQPQTELPGKVNDLTWIDADSFGSVFTHHGSNLFLRFGALAELHQALKEVCDSDLLHAAAKYLMPFVLEYSLIAVGSISCFLYFGGIESESMVSRAKRNLIRVFSLAPSDFDKYKQVMQTEGEEINVHSETKVRFSNSVVDKVPIEKNVIHPGINPTSNSRRRNSEAFTNFMLNHDQNPLQKSHLGMFAGVVVMCLTVVACVVFLFSFLQENRFRAEIIFYSTDIIIHSVLLIACICAFVLMKNLAFVSKPVSTDDVLLLIAAFGSLTYEIVNASALFSALTSPNEYSVINAKDYVAHAVEVLSVNKTFEVSHPKHLNSSSLQADDSQTMLDVDYGYIIQDRLQLTSASIGMFQTAIQTLLIFVSLRRYPISVEDAHEMPGRGTIAFLIVGNLSVWVLRTALCKNLQMPVQTVFYGEAPWLLLMNIHLPMLLFFRFHSSVCFADIWKVAYQLLTRPEKQNIVENH